MLNVAERPLVVRFSVLVDSQLINNPIYIVYTAMESLMFENIYCLCNTEVEVKIWAYHRRGLTAKDITALLPQEDVDVR